MKKPIYIASRGSALALAQADFILTLCRHKFKGVPFELKIIKTTGDKLATASLSNPDASLPKGLFTKEIEEALLSGEADLAVHSLKDLPTILPEGLKLAATTKREDVRDVLIYRDEPKGKRRGAKSTSAIVTLKSLPFAATIGTSSTRRAAQILEARPDLKIVPLRGNVGTRLCKVSTQKNLSAIILASAGLRRLGFVIDEKGCLGGNDAPENLRATILTCDEMLPCVGQAALGLEIRKGDRRLQKICDELNHEKSWSCILAERAFLRAMGGGCQSPVGAHAELIGREIHLRAVSFLGKKACRVELRGPVNKAERLGEKVATELKG